MNFKRPIKLISIKSDGQNRAATCYLYDMDKETTYNDRLFKNSVIGKTYYLDEKSNPIEIPEEEIDQAIETYKKEFAAWELDCNLEYERIKAENIATGRFTYSYSPYREGMAETITEILSENIDEFYQATVDCLKKRTEERLLGSHNKEITIEIVKSNKFFTDLLDLAQEGDKLVWQSWNGGFLAYNAGFGLMRDGKVKYYCSHIVS